MWGTRAAEHGARKGEPVAAEHGATMLHPVAAEHGATLACAACGAARRPHAARGSCTGAPATRPVCPAGAAARGSRPGAPGVLSACPSPSRRPCPPTWGAAAGARATRHAPNTGMASGTPGGGAAAASAGIGAAAVASKAAGSSWRGGASSSGACPYRLWKRSINTSPWQGRSGGQWQSRVMPARSTIRAKRSGERKTYAWYSRMASFRVRSMPILNGLAQMLGGAPRPPLPM